MSLKQGWAIHSEVEASLSYTQRETLSPCPLAIPPTKEYTLSPTVEGENNSNHTAFQNREKKHFSSF